MYSFYGCVRFCGECFLRTVLAIHGFTEAWHMFAEFLQSDKRSVVTFGREQILAAAFGQHLV